MGSAGFRGLAYRCAWAAFEEREYATVSTVKNACKLLFFALVYFC